MTSDRKHYFDTPEILYKYFSPHLVTVIRNFRLRCTPHEEFKDALDSFHVMEDSNPPELNPIGSPIYHIEIDPTEMNVPPRDLPQYQRMLKWVEASASRYPGYVMYGAHIMDPLPSDSARSQYAAGLRDGLAQQFRNPLVVCFSSDPAQRLMWENYADALTGFCIGFSRLSKFLTQPQQVRLRRVIYSEEPSTGPLEVALWRRWIVKHPDYSYEKEWRLLVPKEITLPLELDNGNVIRTIYFDRSDIVQIVFGSKIEKNLKELILSSFPKNVTFFDIEPKFGGYVLTKIST